MNIKQTPEEKYIEIVNQIKELEAKKDSLNAEIVAAMNESGVTNNKTENGEFLLAWRKSWEYTPDTQLLEDQLKDAKKREEANGKATIGKQTEYLRFIPKKVEEIK